MSGGGDCCERAGSSALDKGTALPLRHTGVADYMRDGLTEAEARRRARL
jgi:hypothetical protein